MAQGITKESGYPRLEMKCKICGTVFNPHSTRRKYCSKECAAKAQAEWHTGCAGYVQRYKGKLTEREREQAILLLYLLADAKTQYRSRPISLNLDALRDAWVQYGTKKLHVMGV